MQFKSLLMAASILGMVSAAAFPDAEADALISELDDTFSLEKRACTSNGCKCKSGTKQGQYCGYCDAVTNAGTGGSYEWNFECNPSGGCCTYKTTTKCQDYTTARKNCGK